MGDPKQLRAEAVQLRRLLRFHRGNLTAIAKSLRVTRQAVALRVAKHGMQQQVLQLRGANPNQRGPRTPTDPRADKQRLLQALASTRTYEDAARRLKISSRNLYRQVEQHGITRAHVDRARRRAR